MPTSSHTVAQHFTGRAPAVRQIYERLLAVTATFGPVVEDAKKSSIHLNHKTAFAGIATQKDSLILTLKSAHDLKSRRIRKHEQTSANRWHLEIKLTDPREVDEELTHWLQLAHALSGS